MASHGSSAAPLGSMSSVFPTRRCVRCHDVWGRLESDIRHGLGVVFHGTSCTGKSMLAYLLARKLMSHRPVQHARASRRCDINKLDWRATSDASGGTTRCCPLEVLVFDSLGGGEGEHLRHAKVEELFGYRNDNMLATIVTTTFTPDELRGRHGTKAPMVSRSVRSTRDPRLRRPDRRPDRDALSPDRHPARHSLVDHRGLRAFSRSPNWASPDPPRSADPVATHFEKVFVQHLVLDRLTEAHRQRGHPSVDAADRGAAPARRLGATTTGSPTVRSRPRAPTPMRTMFANVLVEHEIDLDVEPEDTVDFAITALRESWIDRQWQTVADALRLGDGQGSARPEVGQARRGHQSAHGDEQPDRPGLRAGRCARRHGASDGALRAARGDAPGRGGSTGCIFGFEAIDTHTSGIRPGELAIVASPPKTGKSWLLLNSAYRNWLAGGVPVLDSLENSVDLTLDRLACQALGVERPELWQRGECTPEEVAART